MKKFPFLAVFLEKKFRKCDRPLHPFFLNVQGINILFFRYLIFLYLKWVIKRVG